jgi:hypothetical protein
MDTGTISDRTGLAIRRGLHVAFLFSLEASAGF